MTDVSRAGSRSVYVRDINIGARDISWQPWDLIPRVDHRTILEEALRNEANVEHVLVSSESCGSPWRLDSVEILETCDITAQGGLCFFRTQQEVRFGDPASEMCESPFGGVRMKSRMRLQEDPMAWAQRAWRQGLGVPIGQGMISD